MTGQSKPTSGLVEAWRLGSDDPFFLDHDAFHLLADQAILAQLRAALGRGVGCHWEDDGLDASRVEVVQDGDAESLVVLGPGRYAGFTVGGLPIWGSVPAQSPLAVPLPTGEGQDPAYSVVALAAADPPVSRGLRLVVQRLPVDARWLAWHLPLDLVRWTGKVWTHMGWQPHRVQPRRRPPAERTDADRQVARMRRLAHTLLAVSRRFGHHGLSQLATAALEAAVTMAESPSPSDQWVRLSMACTLAKTTCPHYTPLSFRWPRWLGHTLGPAAAHFDTPLRQLVSTLTNCLHQLVAAAEGRRFEFGDLRSQWWKTVAVTDIVLLPWLRDPSVEEETPRAAELLAHGVLDKKRQRWDFAVPRDIEEDERILLMVVPPKSSRKSAKTTMTLEMELIENAEENEKSSYTFKVRSSTYWAWRSIPGKALFRRSQRVPRVSIRAEKMPPTAACLLFRLRVGPRTP